MTFKVGDKVRRKASSVDFAAWPHGRGGVMTVIVSEDNSLMFEGDSFFWTADRFEPVYEPVSPPKASLTAWTDAEIGPFYVQVGSRTSLSAVDTLNRLWFNDPVGQRLNQIEIEYKESPDMTDDQLVQKIMTELESMEQVTRVLIDWKSRPNGIAWKRD